MDVLQIIINAVNNASKVFNDVRKSVDQLNTKLLDNKMKVMGAGFALLFMGMSLRRFFEGMTKSVFTAYQTIMGETSKFGAQVGNLQAAFAFLKFSIFDALANTEFFATLVDWIVQLVNGISEFISKHPAVGRFIVAFAIFGIILSGIAVVLGNLSLAMVAFGLTALAGVAVFFLLIAVLSILAVIWTSDIPTWAKVLSSIVTIVGGIVLAMILLSKTARIVIVGVMAKLLIWLTTTIFGAVILGIVIIVAGILWMSQAWGGLGNFMKVVIGGAIILFANMGQSIAKSAISPLLMLLELLHLMADAYLALAKAMGLPYQSIDKAGRYLEYFKVKLEEWSDLGRQAVVFTTTNEWFKSADEAGGKLTEGASGAMGAFNIAKNTLLGPLNTVDSTIPTDETTAKLDSLMSELKVSQDNANLELQNINSALVDFSGGSNLAELARLQTQQVELTQELTKQKEEQKVKVEVDFMGLDWSDFKERLKPIVLGFLDDELQRQGSPTL